MGMEGDRPGSVMSMRVVFFKKKCSEKLKKSNFSVYFQEILIQFCFRLFCVI